jgi:hypothetical protein
MTRLSLEGLYPDSWYCVDCGVNTAPGLPNRAEAENAFAAGVLKAEQGIDLHVTNWCEIYTVRESVWKAAAWRRRADACASAASNSASAGRCGRKIFRATHFGTFRVARG